MTSPRFLPVPAQPQRQQSHLFTPPAAPAPVQELAPITGLNASVSVAASTSGWAYTAAGIAYRCGAVTFTTTAGIAAGSQLFTVTFQHPFRVAPIVVCSGGPNAVSAFLAAAGALPATATAFNVFNVNALGIGAGQVMQWIAIGV